MTAKTLLLFVPTFVLLLATATLIAWRLRRLSALREDAERRAAVALEELNRFTQELRERDAAPSDPSLAPGARLRQMYPGAARLPVSDGSEAQ